MSDKYILALDQGTTGSRAILFNREGQIVSESRKEFTQIYVKPGWVEHDPMELWSSQLSVISAVTARSGIEGRDIVAVGITNQRETTIIWDRKTGEPVYNAIVWQDRRTAAACEKLEKDGYGNMIQKRTGLIPDAYFSATKIAWILNSVRGLRSRASAGELCFGTVDSWLLWKLTGGVNGGIHATDITNASRTMLYNIHTLEWDEELLKLFNIPLSLMPEVKTCSEVYGMTDSTVTGFRAPLSGVAGDQQASLFGHLCINEGMVKNTYGTGCFMIVNTGDKPVASSNRLLTTIAWQLGDELVYALEGSVFIAGAAIQWLRDGLGIIKDAPSSEELALGVEDNGGVYFVPALSGLGAPWWDPYARGTITGITRGTTSGHFARAALESIALQVRDVLKAMEKDYGRGFSELRVDGGASSNNLLMQFQSDILGMEVVRPAVMETTALGAAYLAGLAVGFWDSIEELKKQWTAERFFSPSMSDDKVQEHIAGWQKALAMARS
ncbi:MAG: glycerol kinase GlpK [Bacteroidales bacterium]|nr:glycerol kinase GlpK [Bacteroidales bacterium]